MLVYIENTFLFYCYPLLPPFNVLIITYIMYNINCVYKSSKF
nr:MAG TPA: hypothetical protein [Caudoviricetes sp.]